MKGAYVSPLIMENFTWCENHRLSLLHNSSVITYRWSKFHSSITSIAADFSLMNMSSSTAQPLTWGRSEKRSSLSDWTNRLALSTSDHSKRCLFICKRKRFSNREKDHFFIEDCCWIFEINSRWVSIFLSASLMIASNRFLQGHWRRNLSGRRRFVDSQFPFAIHQSFGDRFFPFV